MEVVALSQSGRAPQAQAQRANRELPGLREWSGAVEALWRGKLPPHERW